MFQTLQINKACYFWVPTVLIRRKEIRGKKGEDRAEHSTERIVDFNDPLALSKTDYETCTRKYSRISGVLLSISIYVPVAVAVAVAVAVTVTVTVREIERRR
ncbi:hypothetical protein J3Q64DRAFT_1693287 [Phycomyces blakesleeanus]|uniref:Uncharacterized protein n=1 Tax=Phycomyces blakesleeanus TaxID=4837 RepID=A0ABR3BDB4_PHYBL